MIRWKPHLRNWPDYWLLGLVVFSFGGLFLSHLDLAQNLSNRLAGPTLAHPLGTDLLGRDLGLRLLSGARISLLVGIFSTVLSLVLATVYGMLSGYLGGRSDYLLMRLLDVLSALPLTLFILLFMIFFGSNCLSLILAIGFTGWFSAARLIRTRTLDLRRKGFILSSLALGQSHLRIILHHILPNIRDLILSYAMLILPNAILMESFLSFLGLGIPPPQSSWGTMIVEGARLIKVSAAQLLLPSACLMLTLLALQRKAQNV